MLWNPRTADGPAERSTVCGWRWDSAGEGTQRWSDGSGAVARRCCMAASWGRGFIAVDARCTALTRWKPWTRWHWLPGFSVPGYGALGLAAHASRC
ncbi:hypothetical protein M011DRAFT_248915 [Sporormia fimetaria CBS 119925]|uniref:Uncharacterized protein n=1 Tax=Sporormia fimetaria CBS 119925 TaxID=1340428 RepID=A0A6A6V0Z9_9PLEO|nr:hypothetical protein M011DRAFT_248915 [Sporormia fimetaria CBS 119925]